MFIAHLPAGYILSKTFLSRKASSAKAFLLAGLFFSIAPDLDLLWFYTWGLRKVPHHQYITHWPLFWIGLAAASLAFAFLLKKPSWNKFILIGLANVLLHLILDSVAAEIYWLAPFSYFTVNLVNVPASHSWWVWNFVLHWTFALELAICTAAMWLYLRRNKL